MLRLVKEMVRVFCSGRTVQSMKVTGRTIKLMEKADSFMLIRMSTWEIGRTIKRMVMVSIYMLMVPNTKENGSMINSKAKVKKSGKTVLSLKVNTWTERNTGMASSSGLMEVNITESSRIIISTAKENTDGQTAELSKANGSSIKCTVMVSLHGMMAGNTKGIIMMTKNKEEVFSHGQMVEDTMVDG